MNRLSIRVKNKFTNIRPLPKFFPSLKVLYSDTLSLIKKLGEEILMLSHL
jgi:hypothetical protein